MAWKSRRYFISLARDAGARQTKCRAFRIRRKAIKVKQKERSRILKSVDTEVVPYFLKSLSSAGTEGTSGGKFCVEFWCHGMI